MVERLTHILLIYSGITIFLIPLVEDGALFRIRSPVFVGFLLVFLGLLVVSMLFTVRLMIPTGVVFLGFPKRYYQDYRAEYEEVIANRDNIKDLLKASYIKELQEALEVKERQLKLKLSFHNKAMIFALLAVVPYIICLGFHLSKGQDNKNPVSKTEKISNFMETTSVRRQKDDKKIIKESPKTSGELPGVDNNLVLDSHPIYGWETSSRTWTYDAKGNKVYIK